MSEWTHWFISSDGPRPAKVLDPRNQVMVGYMMAKYQKASGTFAMGFLRETDLVPIEDSNEGMCHLLYRERHT